MNQWLSLLYIVVLIALTAQAWKCIACALYFGPYSDRPKPRTAKEKQNEFLAKMAAIMIVASTFNILRGVLGG